METPSPLPIDPLLPGIREALERGNAAVVTAEPGAGKTTRVPPALLSASFAQGREIWVLQPRRLAAKLAALRVAEETGGEAGGTVGYQFRFESRLSKATRLRFLTDGMLLPLALSDPTLSSVAAVVLDEFHERSLALDLGLAYLRRLQQGPRPDLRLLVMSATLDAGPLSGYLSGCPVFRSEGRVFPVSVEYHPFPGERDLAARVRSALRHPSAGASRGTTLVFLPGMAEIRSCQKALEGGPFEVHALYGGLPVEEQQRVLRPSSGNKVILSTNVAETSLTVPGVTAVVDSGLTRQSRISSWSGLSGLVTVPASQASAAQRAGRAGRLQAGACLRLYSKFDFDHRPAFDLPEILRSDLSKSLLDLKRLGLEDPADFPWFQAPLPAALESARLLLEKLGALDPEGRLTRDGEAMVRLPLSPRLSRFLLEAHRESAGRAGLMADACRLAALVSEERPGSPDLLEELKKYRPDFEARRLAEQLEGLARKFPSAGPGTDSPRTSPPPDTGTLLSRALLAAFPDRVARLRPLSGAAAPASGRGAHQRELLLCEGGSALVGDGALTRSHEYFTVVEAQETDQAGRTQARVRSLCPIEEDWLLDLFPDRLAEETTCEWNGKAKRVEGFKRLKYGQLVLDEKPMSAKDFGPETADLLYAEALSAGPPAYCDPEELEGFLNRTRFAAERAPGFPAIGEEKVKETLRELCAGCRSFADLKEAGLTAALRAGLSPKDQSLLERLAPVSVALASGRRMAVHYDPGKPPWGESRIQDFFGMRQGPAVGGGEVPLVLHLLSPARRPVQVTSDLEGFWRNHYPQIRRELSRRYPRHKWPENP